MTQFNDPVTLANCESEPIHVPGAIQPHGALLAVDLRELCISQVSSNLAEFFGVEPDEAIGKPIVSLLDEASGARLVEVASAPRLREVNPFRLTSRHGIHYDAVAHRSGDRLVIEVERARVSRTETVSAFDPRLRSSVLRLQNASTVAELTATVAEEVRALTGFDRVMVYRFDAQWNGEVVAESKQDALESFHGWHYPASDIPAQARRLYTVNWLRFIVDVGYRPAALIPALDPQTQAPLDMSHSILRSVSPIHIEYLRNMGVQASMSISLVIDGVLAGLIACHHYGGPFLVPLNVRDTAEYLGYALSWQLKVVESSERANQARAAQRYEAELAQTMAVASDLLDGLGTPSLMALTEAHGVAIVLQEGTKRLGNTPGSAHLQSLVRWLAARGEDVFVSDNLAEDLPEVKDWEAASGGLLAVAIAPALGEYILWFRAAEVRVVNWGGDPRKAVTIDQDNVPRLSPRGSFALWEEVIKGRCKPWMPWQVDAASSLRRMLLGGVRKRAAQLREMNLRLLDADRAKDEFLATVSHELRTPLNAISGWSSLLKQGNVDAERSQHALEVINRNAQVQTQLIEDLLDVSRITSGKLELDVSVLDLTELITSAIDSSSLALEAKRLEVKRELPSGDSLVRGDASRLRQVIANLLTNAIKFTKSGGQIKVGLRKVHSSFEIFVEDDGQGIEGQFLPHVFEPFRQEDGAKNRRHQGLGLGLAIVKKLVELHGGQVSAESAGHGQGATFRVLLPVTPVTSTVPFPAESANAQPSPVDLAGVEILVVEDDGDSRDLIATILAATRAKIHAVSDAQTALDDLSKRSFDVIVSDIGLPGMDGLEFMQAFRSRTAEKARPTPAVALTAYTRASDRVAAMQAGFHAHVPKPVDAGELIATVLNVFKQFGNGTPR